MKKSHIPSIKLALSVKMTLACALAGLAFSVHSATTDIAPAPLGTSPTASVLPNVFLMLDDSGSMGWDYMPDKANNFDIPEYGGASSQCNGVFYDPEITYAPPVTSTGAIYADASFAGAWTNGFNIGAGTVNLSTSFVPSGGGTAAPAYYYKYIGTETTEAKKNYYNTLSTFYTECNTAASSASILITAASNAVVNSVTVSGAAGGELLSAPTTSSSTYSTIAGLIVAKINACTVAVTGACTVAGYHATIDSTNSNRVFIWPPSTASAGATLNATVSSGTWSRTLVNMPASPKFLRVVVSTKSGPGATDERTNFANWYSYYRTRMLMMKTATGRAFNSVSSTFRVGYGSLNNNTSSDFLALNTFDATQKAAWYGKLYAATPNNSTPLREALAKVGRMYAMKLPSNTFNGVTVADPVQYSCQQNFTLLTTDGFWNGNAGYKLDGTAVGNQDYFEPRPMYDGSNVAETIVTPYTTVQQRQKLTSGVITTYTWAGKLLDIGAACSTAAVVPTYALSTAPMFDDYNIALGLSATDPDPGRCYQLGGTGAGTAWACRSATSGGSPAVSSAMVVDSNSKPWYLSNNPSASLAAPCINDEVLFSSTSYSKRSGVCPGTLAVTGNTVTTIPYTALETFSGATSTSVDNYTANQTTTQTITNGVPGPVGALTPSPATYVFTSNVSTSSTPYTSDVVGPWVAGASSSACVATASLPATDPEWVWNSPQYTTSSTAGTSTTTVLSTVGPTAGTPTTTTSNSGGTSDTLADVAEYYYITDLRTSTLGNNLSGAPSPWGGTDVSTNNVPSSGLDSASHQHMTTFTLGLGARGRMVFDPSYLSQSGTSFTPADYFSVKQGSTANGSTVCSWQTSGACNWSTPASDAIENIDDLWHAAVNGRGTYFSAGNPSGLSTALTTALAGVSARTGAAAAATTSNAFVTQGDNFLFRSTFVTQQWTGELERQQIDVNTGDILPTIDWAAQAKLDAKAARNIYFYDSLSSTKLSPFTYANLSAAQKAYFDGAAIASLTQLCTNGAANCLPVWAPTTAYAIGDEYRYGTTWYRVTTAYTSGATFNDAAGLDTTRTSLIDGTANTNLVNFIRGDRSYEGVTTDTSKYFRQRTHVLGDIVNAESHYVKGAFAHFADPGYTTYSSTYKDRQAMVYVGANDGMLHAFYAADGKVDAATGLTVSSGGVTVVGGDEAWAYVPSFVMPNLYKLADKDYALQHQYFVDGTPAISDICISSCTTASAVWKTILVGGLNAGGKGYYALDITNPMAPKALWEFTDTNLGYTFGNPKIVKLKTGAWVVLFTSGYNNIGDGVGRLYVLNAATGTLINEISTGVGDITTPSGLARIDAPLATPGVDATLIAAYGGDMLGNVWRFDVNGDIGAAGYDAQLLATLKDNSGNAQPITSKPLITLVGTAFVVNVGTGRYLGSSDLPDTQQQSYYAMKDPFTTGTTPSVAIYGNPRTEGTFVQQTQTSTTCPVGTAATICTSGQTVVVSSNNAVNFSSNGGWYFDFPLAGERNNTDAALSRGTLVLTTNVPNASACSVGGDSYLYQLDYRNGGAVTSSGTNVVAVKLGNELATRPVIACLSDGSCRSYVQLSGGGVPKDADVWVNDTGTGIARRTSWRELME